MFALLLGLALSGPAGSGKPPEGAVCNAAEVAAAARHLAEHPDDLTVRRRLLTYYLHRHQDPALRQARIDQIAWMVEHYPEARLYDQRAWIVDARDREGFARVRALWLEQVRRFPDSPQVLANAGLVLSLSDREAAAGWLKKAGMMWDLGMLYADAITGVTARTPYYATGPVDAAEAQSPFARRVLRELRQSTDAVLVFHAGWHLHLNCSTMAGEFLERAVVLAKIDYQAQAYRQSLETFRRRTAQACLQPAQFPQPDGLVVNGICP